MFVGGTNHGDLARRGDGVKDALTKAIAPAERAAPVSLFVAGQRTALRRQTDTRANARRNRRRSVAGLIALREAEDENFAHRTELLGRRMEDLSGPADAPKIATVTSGAEFLKSLVVASRRGAITNLVIYGHAAPTALYMLEDRGFYATVNTVAKQTRVVTGSDAEKVDKLRTMGARDLADLQKLVKNGEIRFSADAVIVFAGCSVAGRRAVESLGIAARAAEVTGATTIASIDVTDQSMARGRDFRDKEYSRGTWVRFRLGVEPRKLNTRVIDVLKYLNRTDRIRSATPAPDGSGSISAVPDLQRFRCALAGALGADPAGFCGARPGMRGNAAAELRGSEAKPAA